MQGILLVGFQNSIIPKKIINLLGSFQEGVLELQELTDAFTEMHWSETWNPQALAEWD